MRHQHNGRLFNRTSAHRSLMFRNMLASLIKHERIETTLPKAKELRILADKMVTLGKRGDLHARRLALALVHDKDLIHKLFADIAQRNINRNGGYTRVLKTGFRYGDSAPMSIIEFVEKSAAA